MSKRLRKEAKGRECQLQEPGVCNFDWNTTVLAHFRRHTGLALKPPDWRGAWLCSACHDLVDGRSMTRFYSEDYRELLHRRAWENTMQILIDEGKIQIP